MPEHSSERFQYTERDLLIQLRSDVKNLADEYRRTADGIHRDLKDYEQRIRSLENFRWWIMGTSASAGFIGTIVARAIWH